MLELPVVCLSFLRFDRSLLLSFIADSQLQHKLSLTVEARTIALVGTVRQSVLCGMYGTTELICDGTSV